MYGKGLAAVKTGTRGPGGEQGNHGVIFISRISLSVHASSGAGSPELQPFAILITHCGHARLMFERVYGE